MPKRYALISILPIIPSSEGFAKAFFGVRPGFTQDGNIVDGDGASASRRDDYIKIYQNLESGVLPGPDTLGGSRSIQKILLDRASLEVIGNVEFDTKCDTVSGTDSVMSRDQEVRGSINIDQFAEYLMPSAIINYNWYYN